MGSKEEKEKLITKGQINKLIKDSEARKETGVGIYERPLTEEQREELRLWRDYLSYDDMLIQRSTLILEKKTLQRQNRRLRETQAKFNLGYRGTITKILNNFLDLFFVVSSLWIGFILGNVKSLGFKAVISKGTVVFVVATSTLAFLIALLNHMRSKSRNTVKIGGDAN